MNKLKIKSFLLGVVVSAVIGTMAVPTLATTLQKVAELTYRDIKIVMNGNPITPTDVNGNEIEPFIIDGTTYLPVRGIANALDLEVGWNGETNTVTLDLPEQKKTIYVTRTGKKYHYSSTCNGGTYYPVPLSTALGWGLEPCDKCVLVKSEH